jgi:hypothetical protein
VTQSYQAFGHEQKLYGAPAPQLPSPKPPVGELAGIKPPTRDVWGAGDPQGAKNNIKYRPRASVTQSYQARPQTKLYIYIFGPLGAPAPQLPSPKPPVAGLAGGRPPTWEVWGAGDPQGAKNNIKYRPRASVTQSYQAFPRQKTGYFVSVPGRLPPPSCRPPNPPLGVWRGLQST